jgi:predicted RNA binding protein YcfA (HicA-like mRNA interferase family)
VAPRLRPLPFRRVQKALVSLGFSPVRQRGSHVTFQHPDGRSITVPNHPGKNVAAGTLRGILRYLGMSFEEFVSQG